MNKITNHLKTNKRLTLIVLLAVVLRFVAISNIPPSLNWDEISHGYNAYSILKTGHDEWGVLLPRIFRAYGDYKLPVYIYFTAILELFFGLTAFAVRLPSVLAGVASVAFTYFLALELAKIGGLGKFGKSGVDIKYVALLSAFLVAVEPWSLFLSRGAFEANLALFFIIAGVYFFLRGLKKPLYYPLSTIFLGLSVWTYNSARVFVPMLFVLLNWIFRREIRKIWNNRKDKSNILYSIFIILVFFLPMFYQLTNPIGQARYSKVSILDEGAINQIIERRNNSNFSPVLSRLAYNRATYFGKEFVGNYLSHLSPKFLFLEGGDQYQFSMPGHGLIYLVNLPFFYLGLAVVVAVIRSDRDNSKRRRKYLIISWLLLAPIPSSLTREAPHVLRSITMLPIPMIITSFGISKSVDWLRIKLSKSHTPHTIHYTPLVVYVLVLLGSLGFYLNNYFTNYRTNYSWSWQYGYEQIVDYAKDNYDKYDKIVVTKKYGEPHEFFLFYGKWDPENYRNDSNLIRFEQSEWFWVDRFDKFYFVNDWQIAEAETDPMIFNLESKKEVSCKARPCLLITSPENSLDGWELVETINFLDDRPAFEIYKN